MLLVTAYSNNNDAKLASQEIFEQFKQSSLVPKFVLYFGSAAYVQKDLAEAMYETMQCECLGCTSAAEYYGTELKHNSVVAMGFSDGFFADKFVKIIPVSIKSEIPFNNIAEEISNYFGIPFSDLEDDKYFGLLLDDFTTLNQNYFIRTLKKMFKPKITLFGGSASDMPEYAPDKTKDCVHYNGEIFPNSVILTIFKPACKFKFNVMYSHIPADVVVKITELGENNRIVKKINNKKAIDMFVEALKLAETEISHNLIKYALGLKTGENSYSIFATNQIFDDGSMMFFADMIEDEEYYFMRYSDMCRNTRRNLKLLREEMANDELLGMIQFNCIGRYYILLSEGEEKQKTYSSYFDFCPHIGFASSSEFFNDFINYTSASILFYE